MGHVVNTVSKVLARLDWNPRERDDLALALGGYSSDAGRIFVTLLPGSKQLVACGR